MLSATLVRESCFLLAILAGIPLLVVLLVGLSMSVFQAVTQIQDQTLAYVPKLVSCIALFCLLGPWMAQLFLRFFLRCFVF